jgi:hypothetical protein
MQYAQQGLSRLLVRELEKSKFTAGHVNFTDQSVNQVMALLGSDVDSNTATLDMSEASDRVSMAHVNALFAFAPEFLEWLHAARSTRAQLPNGDLITLKKFASMGSALCFPVESMVFFTSIIASRCFRAGLFPTAPLVHSFGRAVYVYGDDLIVPANEAAAICDDLESLGFKVNRHKSFWTGQFRESCGADCYNNEKVTPVYLRCDLPADRKDVAGLLSTLSTGNQLYKSGYTRTAMALREAVERVLGRLPEVPVDSPAMGWHFYSEEVPRRRWNKDLARAEMLAWVPYTAAQEDHLDGDPALAKCLRLIGIGACDVKAPLEPISPVDVSHLTTSPRAYALALKRRWVPINPLRRITDWIAGE